MNKSSTSSNVLLPLPDTLDPDIFIGPDSLRQLAAPRLGEAWRGGGHLPTCLGDDCAAHGAAAATPLLQPPPRLLQPPSSLVDGMVCGKKRARLDTSFT